MDAARPSRFEQSSPRVRSSPFRFRPRNSKRQCKLISFEVILRLSRGKQVFCDGLRTIESSILVKLCVLFVSLFVIFFVSLFLLLFRFLCFSWLFFCPYVSFCLFLVCLHVCCCFFLFISCLFACLLL